MEFLSPDLGAYSNVSNSSNISEMTGPFNGSQTLLDPDSSQTYVIMRRFQTVMIPFICVFGIIGNVLAAVAFLSPTLRCMSCCLYLASKTLSDIGFLLSLFIVWLYRVHVPLLNTQGICQTTVFLSYVCGCLSVWFVVAITFENFIRISKPWRVPELLNHRKAVILIIFMVVFTSSLYSFPLWSTGIIPDHNPKCQSLDKYQNVALAMTYVDTVITLVLPSIAMFILVIAIMFSVIQGYKRKLRLQLIAHTANGKSTASSTPEGKVSRFLFAVSIIFLLLHTPSHVVRMRLVLMNYIQHQVPSITDFVIQRFFETFFYLNFALNCVIYLTFGDNFRRVFKQMYFGRCERKNKADVQEANNMSPLMQAGWSSEASCVEVSTGTG